MARDTRRGTGRETYGNTFFRRAVLSGVGIHYCEAGNAGRPDIILLHGFPSTSRMWTRLIPTLATKYHVIAPDYPGFGLSDTPSPDTFTYTFDNIASIMDGLVHQLGIRRYVILMQDYGGPIGFRLAIANPDSIEAIIVQNVAAYDAALGTLWDARKAFWSEPNSNRASLQKNLLSLDAARNRHVGTSPNIELYDPNNWNDDYAMLNRPGMADIQTALFYDYQSNVAAYPQWQDWLRETKPPMQIVWGRYDTSFMVDGASGFERDNPNCETHIIDAGHFPLDERPDDVRRLHMEFLSRLV